VTAWTDAVDALSPRIWLRFDEASGNLTDDANARVFTVTGSPDYGVAGATDAGGDTNDAMTWGADSVDYAISALNYALHGSSDTVNYSLAFFAKTATTGTPGTDCIWHWGATYNQNASWMVSVTDTQFHARFKDVFGGVGTVTVTGLDFSDWAFAVLVISSTTAWTLYVDGVSVDSGTLTGFAGISPTTDKMCVGRAGNTGNFEGSLDELIFFPSALGADDVAGLYAAATGNYPPDTLPMTLQGWLSHPQATLPMTLQTITAHAQATLPMLLQGLDPAVTQAAVAAWSVRVVFDAVDISDQVVGAVSVEHEESSSGLATFRIYPPAGALDPNDYENKSVRIDYETRSSAGAVTSRSRRFTGISSRAVFDPDSGVLTIDATDDLQGVLENTPKAAIDNVIGGLWSEYVFDATADGWQYALDRLSTIASEMHIDNYGVLVVVPWAAKTTADFTLTDAGRFEDSMRLSRATRRDLLTEVTITWDFRFTRLRHREVRVAFRDTVGLCNYLNGAAEFAAKEMVYAAADGNPWTRISAIDFTDLPAAGAYCTPVRVWIGDPRKLFCLAASWTAGRRWAQTVTEVYTLRVYAPDLEEAIGPQAIAESYGVEATYDASEYERDTAFSGPPTGASLSTKSNDYQIDATDAERDGRTAMEAAQECAIAKARTTMLERARRNRLTLSPVFNPAITLAATVRINTPYLIAKGKVYALREVFNPVDGSVDFEITLALSRHGGSGLASDTPVAAPATPEQTQETDTGRSYVIETRAGGVTGAPADDESWDGWITNAYGPAQTDPTNLYRERFKLRMPEIEEAARQATEVVQDADFEVEIPQDELTMSN